MLEFLGSQFSTENIMGNMMWAGIISLLARLWIKFKESPLSKKKEIAFWLLAPSTVFALLLMITFAVTVSSAQKPMLSATIDAINLHPSPFNKDSTGLVLIVSIKNAGLPTILDGWKVIVTLPDGKDIVSTQLKIPESFTLTGPSGTVHYSGRDAIYDKAIGNPIPTGGIVRGLLMVSIDNVDHTIVRQPSTNISVQFKDVLNKTHIVEKQMTGLSSEPVYFPGLSAPGS